MVYLVLLQVVCLSSKCKFSFFDLNVLSNYILKTCNGLEIPHYCRLVHCYICKYMDICMDICMDYTEHYGDK